MCVLQCKRKITLCCKQMLTQTDNLCFFTTDHNTISRNERVFDQHFSNYGVATGINCFAMCFLFLPLVHYWAHVIARGRQYCVIVWLALRQLEMLGISVVTPQCLTVGKAGLATNHTPLTATLVFRCLHPVELQQQQQHTKESRKPRTAHSNVTRHQ